MLSYPPVNNMIRINISSADEGRLKVGADDIKKLLDDKNNILRNSIKDIRPAKCADI